MADVQILHNPKCSKSREALTLLQDHDVDLDVVKYLDTPPTRAELVDLLAILEDNPADLVRRDPKLAELGVDPATLNDPEVVIDVLVREPSLMQRPVVIAAGRAKIARPDGETTIENHLSGLLHWDGLS